MVVTNFNTDLNSIFTIFARADTNSFINISHINFTIPSQSCVSCFLDFSNDLINYFVQTEYSQFYMAWIQVVSATLYNSPDSIGTFRSKNT